MNNLPKNIGFIGLGAMGLPMASRLVKAGNIVYGLDVSTERCELAQSAGIHVVKNLSDVCAMSDGIVLCLPNPSISQEVILGKEGIIHQKQSIKFIIETSTLLPNDVIEFFQQLKEQEIDFLSAPMFGGQLSAEAGTLWFVVEGEEGTYEKYKEIFSMMGKKASYVGKVPQATIAKLARNICRFANVATAIEVINFIRQYSDDVEPIYTLLAEESLTNFDHVWDKTLKEFVLRNEPYYASPISVKDLNIVLGMANKLGIPMPITEVTRKLHGEMQKPANEQ